MVSASTKLTIFGLPLSQPCRAIYTLCKLGGVEYEDYFVDVMSGAHKKPEFLAINPQAKVPALKET